MLDHLLSLVAPHHCSGCEISGTLLCDNCKYDIVYEPFSACLNCGKLSSSQRGLCTSCRVPYQRAWCVADRRDQLQKLIDGFKFYNARMAYRPLADLLHHHLPDLPRQTVIVPVPTVSSHVRQRGYDHMLLIARRLGRLRSLRIDTPLMRITKTTQRGVGARQRALQAKSAFSCRQSLDPNAIYLLVDDVVTSGSTLKYAAKALRDAGANTVWVASVSRQPLE